MRDATGLILSDSNSICAHLAHKHRDRGLYGLWPEDNVQVGQSLMWAGEAYRVVCVCVGGACVKVCVCVGREHKCTRRGGASEGVCLCAWSGQ